MYGIRKKKKYLRVQDLYNDVQLWIRSLHRCSFEDQFNAIHSLFVDWLKEHNETEFLEYWLSTWAKRLFSLWSTGWMFVGTNNGGCMLVSAFASGACDAMWMALVDAAQVWRGSSER
jgi:hypothetical protein